MNSIQGKQQKQSLCQKKITNQSFQNSEIKTISSNTIKAQFPQKSLLFETHNQKRKFYSRVQSNSSMNKNCSSSNKNSQAQIKKLGKQPNPTPLNELPSSHPFSPSGRRLHQQLRLFRFDQKIQEIQSQQIQNLIQHQIQIRKQKQQLNKIDSNDIGSMSPYHKYGFSLRKNNNCKPPKSFHSNKGTSRYNQTTLTKNHKQSDQGHKTAKDNIIMSFDTKIQPLRKSKEESKLSSSNPPWKTNIFYQKYLMKQKLKIQNKSINFFTDKNNQFNKTTPLMRPNQKKSDRNLNLLQKSLYLLNKNDLSIKKNYDYFIEKVNAVNPQACLQLANELKQSKQNEHLLLDSKNKSFSGYNKTRSFLFSSKKPFYLNNSLNQKSTDEISFQKIVDDQLSHLTTYKINFVKPLKIKIPKGLNKSQYLIEEQYPYVKRDTNFPNLNRLQMSSQQYSEDDFEYKNINSEETKKFQQMYVKKIGSRQLQRFLAQRNAKSRESRGSFHHELSAWS